MPEGNQAGYSTPAAANAFQFALLVAQLTARLLGHDVLNEIIIRNALDKVFEIENGKLKNKFTLDDPRAEEYFKRFLEAARLVLEKSFGEEYVKNALKERYEKVKSWAQSEKELELLKKINQKK